VADLYAIRSDPVFRTADFASYINDGILQEVLKRMNLKKYVLDSMGGPLQRKRWISQVPGDSRNAIPPPASPGSRCKLT
jgi:NAD(P)H dehydrogenase (quinone)